MADRATLNSEFTVGGGAPAPADPPAENCGHGHDPARISCEDAGRVRAEQRIRWVLDRLPDSEAVSMTRGDIEDIRAVLGALDAARADVERLRSWAAAEQGDPLATPAQAEYALRTWQETAAGLAADVERLAAQRAAALASADGWESDSSAFSTVPGFRRYVVDGIREALGVTDGG